MAHGRQSEEVSRRASRRPAASGALAFRVPEELRERLRRVTGALDISTLEVMEMGIELAERRIAADEYE